MSVTNEAESEPSGESIDASTRAPDGRAVRGSPGEGYGLRRSATAVSKFFLRRRSTNEP